MDLGPHVISGGDARALALWERCCQPHAHRLEVRRGIITPNGTLDYPIRATQLARHLSLPALARGAAAFARSRLLRRQPQEPSAEGWIVARYGQPLYDALLRSYVEKYWGRSGREVDASFAHVLFGVNGEPRAPAHAPPPTSFVYPDGGCGAVWKRLVESVRGRVDIELDTPIDSLVASGGVVRGAVAGGREREFEHVISTMPIARSARALGMVPPEVEAALGSLFTRHIVSVHLLARGLPRSPYLWRYVLDPAVRVGRVSDFRNWNPGRQDDDETVLTMEYWCGDGDEMVTRDDASVVQVAAGELARVPALAVARVMDGHVTRSMRALPVPSVGYLKALDTTRRYVDAFAGFTTIGRHGGFASSSVVEVMAQGLEAADSIAGG